MLADPAVKQIEGSDNAISGNRQILRRKLMLGFFKFLVITFAVIVVCAVIGEGTKQLLGIDSPSVLERIDSKRLNEVTHSEFCRDYMSRTGDRPTECQQYAP